MPETDANDDWAARTADLVARATAVVRDHSVKPLGMALRIVAVSIVVILVGITAIIFSVIGLVRLFDDDVFSGRVWATDVLVGGMFAALGVFFLAHGKKTRKRHG